MELITTVFALHVINVLLHGFGTYLLARLTRQRNATPQIILLLGLSTTEATMNFLEALRRIPAFIYQDNIPSLVQKVFSYLTIIDLSGTWLLLYLVMHSIIIDRLLVATLGIKYSQYATKNRAIKIMSVNVSIVTVFTIFTVLAFEFYNFNWEDVYFKYIYPSFHFSFIILSTVSYSYIFYKFQKSQKRLKAKFLTSGNSAKVE